MEKNSNFLIELGNEVALTHWAQPNETTYEQICERVVNHICRKNTEYTAERHGNKPYDWEEIDRDGYKSCTGKKHMMFLLKDRRFIPNTPCWINSGTKLQSLAACYVVELEDSMDGIFNTAKKIAIILKEGGGVGMSLSKLRAEGAIVGGNKNRTSSGPVSFLKIFDSIVDTVKSAGVRRGAALANLRVDHPDILKFISCKEDTHVINNFNLSVAISDAFMEKAMKNEEYDLIDHEGKVVGQLNAKDVLDKILHGMWSTGEPGIQFIDNVNRVRYDYTSPSGKEKVIRYPFTEPFKEANTSLEVSNPCGEVFLHPNESCNLGAINLYKLVTPFWEKVTASDKKDVLQNFVEDPSKNKYTDEDKVNTVLHEYFYSDEIRKLNDVIWYAVHFMNSMLDVSVAPLPVIDEQVKKTRKIGIGVMGLADLLSACGITYGSEKAQAFTRILLTYITKKAEEISLQYGYDNATLTLIAPTGTTGLVGCVSQGIEPHFALNWTRNSVKLGYIKDMMPLSLYEYKQSVLHQNFKKVDDIDDPYIKKFWPTAHDVTPKQHIEMLAAVQDSVHNSVSKTINLPHDAPPEAIKELAVYAHKLGIKGFTVYRDGSRESQVLTPNSNKEEKEEEKEKENITVKILPVSSVSAAAVPSLKRSRATHLQGETTKMTIGCGNLYVTVNHDDKGVCEVFTNLGRSGGCPSQSEATSRLISLALRSGIPAENVIEQLKGIRCLSTVGKKRGIQSDGSVVLSCPDAIGKAMERELKKNRPTAEEIAELYKQLVPEKTKAEFDPHAVCLLDTSTKSDPKSICPECHSVMALEGGCRVCRNCGYSKCG